MTHHLPPSPVPCTACGATTVNSVVAIRSVPIHCNLLWPTHEEALKAPSGDITLGFCTTCGHVFNTTFDPAVMEYTQAYENSLHFSPRFQQYADALARRLVERYEIRQKDVIDVGCGKGDFLAMLCEHGDNRGFGVPPAHRPGAGIAGIGLRDGPGARSRAPRVRGGAAKDGRLRL